MPLPATVALSGVDVARGCPNEVLVDKDEVRVCDADELACVRIPMGERRSEGKAFSFPFFGGSCRTLSLLARLATRASTRPREPVFSQAGPKEATGEEHMKQVISRGGLWAAELMRALRQVWQRRSVEGISEKAEGRRMEDGFTVAGDLR